MITDAHTHNLQATNAIIAIEPAQFAPLPGRSYSVGLHPWHTATTTDAHLAMLERCARHEQVIAIGETGLDALQGAPLDRQIAIMTHHLTLAQQLAKPIIIHCVRTSQQVLRLCRQLGITVPCAIHGMRSNERVARPLLDAGFYLSFGPRFNPATVVVTPPERILIETDDTGMGIGDVAALIAPVLDMAPHDVQHLATANLQRFLNS